MTRWSEDQLAEYQSRRGQKLAPRTAASPANSPLERFQALGRLKAGQMNNTEARFAVELELLRLAGEIIWWKFEALKFRLADNTFYTPDFITIKPDGSMEVVEIKSIWRDDARVKIKVAAALFPFKFIALTAIPKSKGGGWKKETF